MKGQRITILFENIGNGGVITAIRKSAVVQYVNGETLIVKDEDGYIREVNRDNYHDGAYLVT